MTAPQAPDEFQYALRQAMQAMRRGDHAQSRRWASLAAQLRPDEEEPWLIMAAQASPQASLAYIKIALEKNPQSQRARSAMSWAIQRARQAPPPPLAATAGLPRVVPEGEPPAGQVPAPGHPLTRVPPGESTQPVPIRHERAEGRRPPLAGWAVILILAMFASLALTAAAGAYVATSRSSSAPKAVAMLYKPSLTPTHTSTPTPTATLTPPPTPTFQATEPPCPSTRG